MRSSKLPVSVPDELENFVKEFDLIQKKKSKLSRNKRDYIELRVLKAIDSGKLPEDYSQEIYIHKVYKMYKFKNNI